MDQVSESGRSPSGVPMRLKMGTNWVISIDVVGPPNRPNDLDPLVACFCNGFYNSLFFLCSFVL